MPLDDTDRAEILVRYRNGQSARQLAGRFGVSPDTIERVIPAQERRPGRWRPRELTLTDQELIDAHDGGESFASLGRRLGLTPSGAFRRYHAACRRRESCG
jgi:hypothetical protein